MEPGPSNLDSRAQVIEQQPSRPRDGQEDHNTNGAASAINANAAQGRPNRPPSPAQNNIVGCRISHHWRENGGMITFWRGTVLEQVAINPFLYLVKYDGVDCVYGLELTRDDRILALQVYPEKVDSAQVPDPILANTIIGRSVEHIFEGELGLRKQWKGMVLSQAPVFKSWFYITYEKDPILYMYELLDDFREGDLRIIPDMDEIVPPDVDMEVRDDLIGKSVEYANQDGSKRVGVVIHQDSWPAQ
ncbi:hypothetical protein NN561_012159 [Cricetulus griseus]